VLKVGDQLRLYYDAARSTNHQGKHKFNCLLFSSHHCLLTVCLSV